MTEPRKVVDIGYESAVAEPVGPRPGWVWVIVVIYGLLAAALVFLPAWIMLENPTETGLIAWASGTAVALTLCGMGLILTPVRAARRRPLTRRSVWIPILSAGFLLGLLVVGAGLALIEFFKHSDAGMGWFVGVWLGGGAVWIGWSILFWLMSGARDATSIASTLHRWVLCGSLAELLVAVPTHLVVRKRPYCCAGLYTATGICIGVVVMIVAFGPSVAFLYYRRWKQKQKE